MSLLSVRSGIAPRAVDLCCGLGGWTDGLLAEGYDVIGFDVERHKYGSHQYPAQLVLQDIRTLDGRQFRGKVSLIVASPPCQEFSYMAMPWTRAKQIAQALYARKMCGDGPPFPDGYTGSRTVGELTALFDACLRIGREAECPIVIENVRGAVPWVGRSRWHYGSYHLWGDVPALMPITLGRQVLKMGIAHRANGETNFHGHELPDHFKVGDVDWRRDNDILPQSFVGAAANGVKNPDGGSWDRSRPSHTEDHSWESGTKNSGDSWFNVAHNTESGKGQNPDGRKTTGHVNRRDGHDHTRHLTNQAESDGVKGFTPDGQPLGKNVLARKCGSKSSARKAASARIAKIPFPLASHIARVYYPKTQAEATA